MGGTVYRAFEHSVLIIQNTHLELVGGARRVLLANGLGLLVHVLVEARALRLFHLAIDLQRPLSVMVAGVH